MTLDYDINRFAALHERLPRFAEIAAECVERLGLEKSGGRGPRAEAASERVIRDYVRRGVLSPTARGADSDERGFYSFRHLVEFLSARVLLNDGWPLDKIAERNVHAATEDLQALIPGQAQENPALALARSFRAESAPAPERTSRPPGPEVWSRTSAGATPDRPASRHQAAFFGAPSASPVIPEPSSLGARMRAELPMLMRAITGSSAPPAVRRRISIEFGDRLTLLIDPERLQRLTVSDAEAIGKAISAALVDYPSLVRGKDPT
jgi:DNA-binding transcriptional MerR regulator